MEELKNKIADLKARIAELRAIAEADRTAKDAREMLAKRKELATAEKDLAVMVEAFEGEEESADETEAPAEVEAPVEAPAVGDAPAEEAAPEAEVLAPVALAASATDVSPTADAADDKPMFGITASATMERVQQGAQLDREMVMAMLNSTSMRSKAKGEGRTRLFEISRFDAETPRVGTHNSAIENTRIIKAAIRDAKIAREKGEAQHATLTAGGCFCGPDEIDASIDAIGSTARPVAGIFPTVPANGGFEFLRDLTINPNSGSTAVWTCTDQDAVDPDDPDTWKVCSELDCFTTESVFPYMLTACTIVGKQHQWAHPEQIDAWINKILIELARLAEQALLDIIDANAVNQLEVGLAGMVAHGLSAQIDYALGSLAYPMGIQFREGGSALSGMVLLIPRGLVEAVLADEAIRGFPSNIETRADLLAHLRAAYGVSDVVERLEERTGALSTAAAATVTALNAGGNIDAAGTPLQPATYRMYLVDPSQWVHMQATLVGADWHQDVALLRQNKNLYFLEDIEGLFHTGYKKTYAIDLNGCIKGAFSDLVTPPAC